MLWELTKTSGNLESEFMAAAGNEAWQLDFGNGALVESFHWVMFLVINDVAILVEHPMETLPLLISEAPVCLHTGLLPL